MKYFLALLTLLSLSFTNVNRDCRNFSFGDAIETVRANESLEFVKEEMLSHNLKGLTFVEFEAYAIVLYTYTFHFEKLNGLKVKKLARYGDNSYLNAYNNYKAALTRYSSDCEAHIKEKVEDKGLRSFHFTSNNKKVYVMMQEENDDYFMVENIFKK
jgi:hypothetical protein